MKNSGKVSPKSVCDATKMFSKLKCKLDSTQTIRSRFEGTSSHLKLLKRF